MHIKTMLLDGDGVLYHADRPAPGLADFFQVLARRGIRWGLVTNNATRPRQHYVDKLRDFGVETAPEVIFDSASLAGVYLQGHYAPGTPVYVIGELGLKLAAHTAGMHVLDGEAVPRQVAAVVAALDRDLTYQKLRVGARLLRAGADFIATNEDRSLPVPDGFDPGGGAIIAALAAASDRKPLVLGKPNAPMFEAAMAALGAQKASTAIVGDRLETDILGGINTGITTILVLSGAATRADLAHSSYQPDMIFEDVAAIAAALET